MSKDFIQSTEFGNCILLLTALSI